MSKLRESVEGKDNCLAGWCKERVSALENINSQWNQLQPLIENHSLVLQRQIDIMRDQIESQMSSLTEEAEKFEIRWETTVLNLKENDTYNSSLFRERIQNWNNIKERREQLENDCSKFNIAFSPDVRELFSRIDNLVQSQGKEWEIFEQFLEEFEAIGSEEWTVYRRRPYIFTDFLAKWNNSDSLSDNAASAKIQNLLEGYQSVLPVLQNLQADGLTDRHWAKTFSLLNKSPKPFHDVLLKDMLLSIPDLLKSASEIQSLVRQASSEQIVRQALTELDQWGVTATLKTIAHTDSKGETVHLIKDFQDALNKVGYLILIDLACA